MYIEYCLYDRTLSEKEISKEIEKAIDMGVKNFCLLPYSLSSLKNTGLLKDINVCVPLDYPFGVMDIDARKEVVTNLLKKYKIQALDVVAPSKILSNNKYSKFREDIDNVNQTSENYGLDIRYILEYRLFNYGVLSRCCQILSDKGIETIVPSTGNMIDDIHDNIIACKYLESKSKINTICSGNVYHNKHLSLLRTNNIQKIRAFNINTVNMLQNSNF
tara:strand:- start:10868 stop:11521 length:654 start_codon:yes stop_codon:yes gene_type:complete